MPLRPPSRSQRVAPSHQSGPCQTLAPRLGPFISEVRSLVDPNQLLRYHFQAVREPRPTGFPIPKPVLRSPLT
jgi:hypothetical protein